MHAWNNSEFVSGAVMWNASFVILYLRPLLDLCLDLIAPLLTLHTTPSPLITAVFSLAQ